MVQFWVLELYSLCWWELSWPPSESTIGLPLNTTCIPFYPSCLFALRWNQKFRYAKLLLNSDFFWFIVGTIFIFCVFSVNGGTDSIDGLRYDNDGCDRWYCSSVRRGRNRFSLGYFLDSSLKLVLYSSLLTSARVLVYRARYHLSVIYTFYVLAFDFVLGYQSECSIVGYAWGADEENEKGKTIWNNVFSFLILNLSWSV